MKNAENIVSRGRAKKMRPVGDVDDKMNATVVDVLNHLLGAEYILFTKTLNYHWNVIGPRFFSLHQFLEKQYKELLELMDSVAERIRVLGEFPYSTCESMAEEARMPETEGGQILPNQMLADLLRTHLTIQQRLKGVLDTEPFEADMTTQDFVVDVLKHHEKMAWMLKSHLETGH